MEDYNSIIKMAKETIERGGRNFTLKLERRDGDRRVRCWATVKDGVILGATNEID